MSNLGTVWAFDLGKGSIGEAVRLGDKFLHKASLLIPADFAETKTAAGRRRMWRTRQAHKAREQWLNDVMRKAGIEVLHGRKVEYVDYKMKTVRKRVKGKVRAKLVKYGGKWKITKGDERLEREFAKPGETCYTSCLLRIKLLHGDPNLEDWQIYKALHSAIQKRGYGKVPWAAKEAARQGMTPKELEDKEKVELAKKDPAYQAAVNAWRDFKKKIQQQKLTHVEKLQPSNAERKGLGLPDDFYFVPPSFYDAVKMELWNPAKPDAPDKVMTHNAASTRRVRFDREDIERETVLLGNQAASLLPQIKSEFDKISKEGWLITDAVSGCKTATGEKYQNEKRVRRLKVLPETFGEFLCHGPGGKAYAAYDPKTVKELQIEVLKHPNPPKKAKRWRRGSNLDWLGGVGQKIPRFDNRIIEKCALIPRLNVCRAGAKPGFSSDSSPDPDSLLYTEVAFLLKLKNVRVLCGGKVEQLAPEQIQELFKRKQDELSRLRLKRDDPKYAEKIADIFSFGKMKWANVGDVKGFGFKPYVNHDEIEAPKCGGRSRFSRPALKILRELILSGDAPSVFRQRLLAGDKERELLLKLGTTAKKDGQTVTVPLAIFPDSNNEEVNKANRMKGLLVSELEFLNKMRKADETKDSWNDIFIPNEKLDGLVLRLQNEPDTANQRQRRDEAIHDLIGSQNDPVVRHRLKFFWARLQALERLPKPDGTPMGEPVRIVLEFAREDFLGKKAKKRWQEFNKSKRDQNTKAREHATNEKDELKIKLWQDQGGECVYGKPVKKNAFCVYTQRALPPPGTKDFDDLEIDHIVPRDMGGPNAYVNYVLTFREVANQQKRDRIPYVWFFQDRFDELSAHIKFVQSKKESLGRKKVALLTRPDAAELVERYTALAQTAWIARLAQTIVRLHFGWPLDHQKGEERVLTLTGGQTAQFRREFRLNSLLGENAKLTVSAANISKAEEEEIAAKIQDDLMKETTKNRVDPRHHALDAMVLTLIPEWRHYDAKKWAKWRGKYLDAKRQQEILNRSTPFFDSHLEYKNGKEFLNKNSIRQLVARMLAETHAKLVAFESPKLEETHYDRTTQQFEKGVRKPLNEIACTHPTDPTNRKFDEAKLRRWTKRCLDEQQKEALDKFVNDTPTSDTWEQFKKSNKKLFPGGKAQVTAPQATVQYTVRKELRLLAYENDQSKTEWIFKSEWARQAAEEIEAGTPVMLTIKGEIEQYLNENPETTHAQFAKWLKARCEIHSLKRIILHPLADKSEEADSKRRSRPVSSENFGCMKMPLVFKVERLLKTYAKICDSLIRSKIASEFKIAGEGKKATCRAFTREEWEAFCTALRKPTKKKGIAGPRVLKVTLTAGESDEESENAEVTPSEDAAANLSVSKDEYVESTKTPGAFLKGKAHKGYYLYLDRDGHWQRLPVFAHMRNSTGREYFEKIKTLEQSAPNSKFKEVGFLQTGCSVKLESDAKKAGKVVAPAGTYRMNTLQQNGRMKLTAQNGREIGEVVNVFIEAGLHRIN